MNSGFRRAPTGLGALVARCILLAWTCSNTLSASPPNAAIFLRANQVGYTATDTKVAVAFSTSPLPSTFAVITADTGLSVFEGKTVPLSGERWGKFDQQAELDFTMLTRPGRYLLRIGEARSLPIAIGEPALFGLSDQLLEFMRQQRCGYNPWLRREMPPA